MAPGPPGFMYPSVYGVENRAGMKGNFRSKPLEDYGMRFGTRVGSAKWRPRKKSCLPKPGNHKDNFKASTYPAANGCHTGWPLSAEITHPDPLRKI